MPHSEAPCEDRVESCAASTNDAIANSKDIAGLSNAAIGGIVAGASALLALLLVALVCVVRSRRHSSNGAYRLDRVLLSLVTTNRPPARARSSSSSSSSSVDVDVHGALRERGARQQSIRLNRAVVGLRVGKGATRRPERVRRCFDDKLRSSDSSFVKKYIIYINDVTETRDLFSIL